MPSGGGDLSHYDHGQPQYNVYPPVTMSPDVMMSSTGLTSVWLNKHEPSPGYSYNNVERSVSRNSLRSTGSSDQDSVAGHVSQHVSPHVSSASALQSQHQPHYTQLTQVCIICSKGLNRGAKLSLYFCFTLDQTTINIQHPFLLIKSLFNYRILQFQIKF